MEEEYPILDLSKIEAGKMDLCLETYDITSMIQDAGPGLHLHCPAPGGGCRSKTVACDRPGNTGIEGELDGEDPTSRR